MLTSTCFGDHDFVCEGNVNDDFILTDSGTESSSISWYSLCWLRIFTLLTDSKVSLPCSKEPSTGIGRELVKSSPSTHVLPITVTTRSKEWTGFSRSNIGIVGSNPAQGMDVFVCSVFVLYCVGSGLETGWSPYKGFLPTVLRLRNWSEVKRVTDALWSEVGTAGKTERDSRSKACFNIILSESLSLFSYVFLISTHPYRSRDSAVGIASSRPGRPRGRSASPGSFKIFLFST
jgi:hypothetical protein